MEIELVDTEEVIVEEELVLRGGVALPGDLVALWSEEKLCDAHVVVEGTTHHAHRVVLAAGSAYLCEAFCAAEGVAGAPLELGGMAADVWKACVRFLYEGTATLRGARLLIPLLEAATRLRIGPLQQAASAALQARLAPDTCLGVWEMAERLELGALAAAATGMAMREFAAVGAADSFVTLPLSRMVAIVRSEQLSVVSEEAVYEMLMRWAVSQSPLPSDDEMASLLEHLRFPCMRPAYVEATVEREPMLANVPCMRILTQAFREASYSANTPRTRERRGFGPSRMYAVGGTRRGATAAAVAVVERFDELQQCWAAMPPLPEPLEAAAAAAVGGELMVAGGCSASGDSLARVHRFDADAAAWRVAPPLRTARDAAAAVACGGALVVAGGVDADKCALASVERLAVDEAGGCGSTTEAQQPPNGPVHAEAATTEGAAGEAAAAAWRPMAPMNTPRSALGMACVGGALYVAGGRDERDRALRSVERLRLGTGGGGGGGGGEGGVDEPPGGGGGGSGSAWEEAAPMQSPRYAFGLASLRGRLYAVGGSDGTAALRTVERYDPASNEWTSVAPLSVGREGVGLVAMQDALYALGGCDDQQRNLPTVERYDPTLDAWSLVAELPSARCLIACASV